MLRRMPFVSRVKGTVAVCTLAAIGTAVVVAPFAAADQHRGSTAGPRTIHATSFVKVSDRHEDSPLGVNYQSLLEGPAFGPDGDLYLTDTAAPAGEPKVLKIDLETKAITPLHTDRRSIYSSAQFSPKDGKLYLTDFLGRVERMNSDGSDVTTVFEGPIDGKPMVTDDIAFDPDGNMYITDFTGTPWEPTGRLIRLDADGTSASVLQDGLARPNGIAFTPDYSRLWVAEQASNQVSNFGLTEDGTAVTPNDAFLGMSVDNGLRHARAGVVPIALDSTAVDADGNVYQAVHGGGQILIWNQEGGLEAIVELDEPDVTNLAIEPGTRDAYATVGGEDGGYVYRFNALANGIG